MYGMYWKEYFNEKSGVKQYMTFIASLKAKVMREANPENGFR